MKSTSSMTFLSELPLELQEALKQNLRGWLKGKSSVKCPLDDRYCYPGCFLCALLFPQCWEKQEDESPVMFLIRCPCEVYPEEVLKEEVKRVLEFLEKAEQKERRYEKEVYGKGLPRLDKVVSRGREVTK